MKTAKELLQEIRQIKGLLSEPKVAAKKVRVPQNARQWQLYDHKEGAEEAAEALMKAANKAIAEFNRWAKKNSHLEDDLADWKYGIRDEKVKKARSAIASKLFNLFDNIIDPVMTKYDKLGAGDSEPYYIAQRILNDAATIAFGVDIDYS